MTDLDELIEAVESGDWKPSDRRRDHRYWESDLDNQMLRVFGTVVYSINVWKSYNGSLDAAKALHDELLPGWGFCIYNNNNFELPTVFLNNPDKDTTKEVDSESSSPSRAWLIAILKAYRSIQ